MKKVTIIGAGSMGCALAKHLFRNDNEVKIYTPFPGEEELINSKNENTEKLPGVRIPKDIRAYTDAKKAFEGAQIVVIATPSQVLRKALLDIKEFIRSDMIFVICSKGIENKTHMLLRDVVFEVLETDRIAVLSGPSHAEEIARNVPTAMVAASENEDISKVIQDTFISEYLRVYTSDDVLGVELGGALKNVIALCAGIIDGLGYGDNTKAALMTRGMVEISRLGEKLGAKRETFFGLTGMGDLIVTCISMYSRNRRAGIKIGQGMPVKEAIKSIKMTVEGYESCVPVYELAINNNVSMPITTALYNIINGKADVKKSVLDLMTRERKDEFM